MRCERCGRETKGNLKSFFDMTYICPECEAKEQRHPDYGKGVRSGSGGHPAWSHNVPRHREAARLVGSLPRRRLICLTALLGNSCGQRQSGNTATLSSSSSTIRFRI